MALTFLYGVSACNENASAEVLNGGTPIEAPNEATPVEVPNETTSPKVIDKGSCPELVLKQMEDFSEFSFQKGNYTVEVTDVKYSNLGYFRGNVIIREENETLFNGDVPLSIELDYLANRINGELFKSTGKYFARDSDALETLLTAVFEKYQALDKKIDKY